jgi:hypothetical protein
MRSVPITRPGFYFGSFYFYPHSGSDAPRRRENG